MTKERAALERILAFVTDPQRMTHWDSWRSYIARGGTASGPRDGFESLLNWIEEEAREALATQVEPSGGACPSPCFGDEREGIPHIAGCPHQNRKGDA